jgi:hypothetical protein
MARSSARPRNVATSKAKERLAMNRTFEEMLTTAVLEKGRLLAVEMIAKRFKDAGVRLSASERTAFAEALTGERPMPTIQRRRPRSAVPSVVALTPEDNRDSVSSFDDS